MEVDVYGAGRSHRLYKEQRNSESDLSRRLGYVMSEQQSPALARGLAEDFVPLGIAVNTVQRGPNNTDLIPADGANSASSLGMIPIGRYGEPRDVAALVSFLSGEDSAFVTGAAMMIDGDSSGGASGS